jgi:hypothetical protein
MIEFLFDGIVIHSRIFYILNKNKRQYFESYPLQLKKDPVIFSFDAYMFPPLFLLPQTWKRYNYSLQDILTTCKCMNASYFWQLFVMTTRGKHEPESSAARIESSFKSLFSFNFKFRTVVDDYIKHHSSWISNYEDQQKTILKKETNHYPSVLCKEFNDHKPYLPKIPLSLTEFNSLKNLLPVREPSFLWVGTYAKYYTFKDIKLIPVKFCKKRKCLYLVRIITEKKYNSMPCKPKHCAITEMAVVIIDNIRYVLLEEACFGIVKKKREYESEISFINNKKKRIK